MSAREFTLDALEQLILNDPTPIAPAEMSEDWPDEAYQEPPEYMEAVDYVFGPYRHQDEWYW